MKSAVIEEWLPSPIARKCGLGNELETEMAKQS